MHKDLNFTRAHAGKFYRNRLPNNILWIAASSTDKQSYVVMNTS